MENKRKEVRVVPSIREPVEIQIMGDGFLDILTAKDIGPGGIGVFVAHGFEGLNIFSDVEVIISIPNEKSFKVRGVIKHKRQLGNDDFEKQDVFGILFTQICDKHRLMLERYVEERLKADSHEIPIVSEQPKLMEVELVE